MTAVEADHWPDLDPPVTDDFPVPRVAEASRNDEAEPHDDWEALARAATGPALRMTSQNSGSLECSRNATRDLPDLLCGADNDRARVHWPTNPSPPGCGRPIGTDELAFRHTFTRPGMFGGYSRTWHWLCESCHATKRSSFRDWRSPVSCDGGCGVHLAYPLDSEFHRERFRVWSTCSTLCYDRARHRRPENAPRPCEVCSETIGPLARSDARYCSPACRQKAYRLRSKDTNA